MFCRLGVLNAFLASDSFNLIWVCQDVTTSKDFLGGSVVKNPPAMKETGVRSLSQEDSLEEGMATHSSILAWRIPWTEEPGGLQPQD